MAKPPKFKLDIREKDLGWGKIKKEAAKMSKKPFVKIGWQGASAVKKHLAKDEFGPPPPNQPTVVDIATFHEFGTSRVPERSMIRATMEKNAAEYKQLLEVLKNQILDASSDMTTERALRILGFKVMSDVKNRVREGIDPPLAETTVRRKNRRQLWKAEATIRNLEQRLKDRDQRGAPKGKRGKLTKAELAAENKASDLLSTGGKSTPLIDTAQMINALNFVVDMDGDLAGGITWLKMRDKK